ncbi:ninjurin-B-like [Adelges cooleyi]|uniref:ninjurin-B-like n=1 Tax=Adelges cooleyi TaxID=133065 RepID=UPI00217FD90D|nr:ninjurin-B-like [Adelges cooleyi]
MSENNDITVDGTLHVESTEEKKQTSLLSRSISKMSNANYDTKKTMAQGMMDIALLTANANQLRYVLELRKDKSTNIVILLTLIACSLVLQVIVGVMLIFKGRLHCSGVENTKMTRDQLNNHVVLGVFLITVINIFISAFTTS